MKAPSDLTYVQITVARCRGRVRHSHWRHSTPEISWRRVFPGEERQVAVLRRWLASLLSARPEAGDLLVVATEMVNNAIRHTASGRGGRFTVEVTWHPAMVRVAVTDGGAPDGPHLIHDPLSENGRGLRLILGMSARSGVSGDAAGRRVWAEIPWSGATVAEPASPPTAEEASILGWRNGPAASPAIRLVQPGHPAVVGTTRP